MRFKIILITAFFLITGTMFAGVENNPPRCNPCVPGAVRNEVMPATISFQGPTECIKATPGQPVSLTVTENGQPERIEAVTRCKDCGTIISQEVIQVIEPAASREYQWIFTSPSKTITGAGLVADFLFPGENESGSVIFVLCPIALPGQCFIPPPPPRKCFTLPVCIHVDSDNDGLPDDWELEHFGNLDQDGNGDFDGDGHTNQEEFDLKTDPNDPNDPPPPGTPIVILDYKAGAGGYISGDRHQRVSSGLSGTPVTAISNQGSHFVMWSDGVPDATREDRVFNYYFTVIAIFATDIFDVTFDEGAYGTRTGGGALIQNVKYGTSAIPPIMTPDEGWEFTGWSSSIDFVTANIAVTAIYHRKPYTITYQAEEHGVIAGVNPQTVYHGGSSSMVTAVADTGYHFASWSDGVTTPTRIEKKITSDITVTASFALSSCTVTFVAGDNGSIIGNLSQTVNYGDSTAVVTATPDTSYNFIHWTHNGIGYNNSLSLTIDPVTENMELIAKFDDSALYPTTPANLQLISVGRKTVSLTWDDSTDPQDDLVGYKIYRDGALIGKVKQPAFVDVFVKEGTEYSYIIEAYDELDHARFSDPLSATPGNFMGTKYYVNATDGDDNNSGLVSDFPKKTIPAAISIASENDVIIVAPGIYNEFALDGKNLIITASSDDQQTTLKRVSLGNLAMLTLLEGFTISDGNAGAGFGGGLLIDSATPVISHCSIQNNTALKGGGIAVTGINSAPHINKCMIIDNIATANGGGIYFATDTYPKIKNCYIQKNNANKGAGIYGE